MKMATSNVKQFEFQKYLNFFNSNKSRPAWGSHVSHDLGFFIIPKQEDMLHFNEASGNIEQYCSFCGQWILKQRQLKIYEQFYFTGIFGRSLLALALRRVLKFNCTLDLCGIIHVGTNCIYFKEQPSVYLESSSFECHVSNFNFTMKKTTDKIFWGLFPTVT